MPEIPLIRRYGDGDRIYVQAQQIWLILAAFVSGPTRKSSDRNTITYGELAKTMGYADKKVAFLLGRQLGIIGEYCVINGLPSLNTIVVNQATGLPGDGAVLSKGKSVKQEQIAVARQNWMQLGIPTTGTLRKVWEAMA